MEFSVTAEIFRPSQLRAVQVFPQALTASAFRGLAMVLRAVRVALARWSRAGCNPDL
jgi:hypothetical protein